jgi:hypothetical protein
MTGTDWLLSGNSGTQPPQDFLGTVDGEPLVIKTSSSEQLRIDPAGHIGLGTTSPQAKLDVSVSGGGSPQPFVARLHQESTLGVLKDSNALLRFSHSNGSNSREWTIGTGSASLFGHPDFFGIHDNISGVGLIINQFAQVGLGTTSPQAKLDVSVSGGGSPQPFVARLHQESTLGVLKDSNALLRFSHSNGSNSREWTIGTGSASLFGHPDFFGIYDTVSGVGLVIDQFANVKVSHNLTAGGDISVSGDVLLTGADCAEQFDLDPDAETPAPGTVMVLGDRGGLGPSAQAYDRKVVGVVSGAGDYRPALMLDNQAGSAEPRVAIALAGKVFCKVDAQYGNVSVGDLLTTSPTPGHAMKAAEPERAFGAVLGKALAALDRDQGLVPIVVALQ